MKTSQAGIDLIKEFEGCELTSYLCPANVWTIGIGHTGDVEPGTSITEREAEDLLRKDLMYFEDAVGDLITVKLSQSEFDALVSFTFNVGSGALGVSTLRKRLNAGEPKCPVFKEELPKWVKADNRPLPGLVRRREAEVELACSEGTPEPSNSYLLDAARWFNEEPHQVQAWIDLEGELDPIVLAQFKAAYSRKAEVPVTPVKDDFPLDVPYFYQRDSKTGHGERMCFSSSMAMALDYVDPEAIEGDDDWYLAVVLNYGDTVSSDAQIAAARSLGFDAEFHTDGSISDLEALLDRGIPVPVGILHHGSVDHPSGGGHWICLIGHDETHFDVHDPFGELDLVGGGYPKAGPEDGKFQRYSKKNFKKRWCIANDSDGWYVKIA